MVVNTCGNPRWREPRSCSSWGQVAHVLTPDNFRLSPGQKRILRCRRAACWRRRASADFLHSCHRVACGRRGADVDEPLAFDAADSTTYGRSMSDGSNYLDPDRPEAV